jgi:hypothetical protein
MGGMLIIFNVQQCVVHFKMKEKLKNDTSNFEYLNLTIGEYKENLLNSHELSFKGKMYDIKSSTFHGDSVKLLVFNDFEEEKIIQMIKALTNTISLPDSKIPSNLKILTLLKYIPSKTEYSFSDPSFQKVFYQQLNTDIESKNPEIQTPPPRLV